MIHNGIFGRVKIDYFSVYFIPSLKKEKKKRKKMIKLKKWNGTRGLGVKI